MNADLTPISEIGDEFIGLEAKISGKIVDIYEHKDNHLFLKVKDGSEETISVPIFAKIRTKLKKRIELLDNIKIKGKVEKYENMLEIIPNSPESIKIIHVSPIPVSRLSLKEGEIVKTKGIITEKKENSNNTIKIGLEKKENNLTVLLSYKSKGSNSPNLHIGDLIQVTGNLELSDSCTILKVRNRRNLKVLEAL